MIGPVKNSINFGSQQRQSEKIYSLTERNGKKYIEPNKEVLDKCFLQLTYEQNMKDIMAPENKFSVSRNEFGDVELKNFCVPSFDNIAKKIENFELPKIKETCSGLSIFFGRFLNLKNPELDVELAIGTEPNYFGDSGSRHSFLQVRHPEAINSMVIDPSFKTVNESGHVVKGRTDNWFKASLFDIYEASPNRVFTAYTGDSSMLPLGFPEQLSTTREAKKVLDDNKIKNDSLLYFEIKNPSEVDKAEFSFAKKEKGISEVEHLGDWQKWLSALERDNPLRKFVKKVLSHPGIKAI